MEKLQNLLRKIVNFISKYKVIFVLSVFLLLIILILRLFTKNTMKILQPPQPPITTQINYLNLISTEPNPPFYKSAWSTDLVVFAFDDYLDPDTISYQISPYTKTRAKTHLEPSKTIEIIPLEGWKQDIEYTISINASLSSLNRKTLQNSIEFTFKRSVPEPEDPEFPYPINEKF